MASNVGRYATQDRAIEAAQGIRRHYPHREVTIRKVNGAYNVMLADERRESTVWSGRENWGNPNAPNYKRGR